MFDFNLPEPNPSPAVFLADERHASSLKAGLNGGEILPHRDSLEAFKICYRRSGYPSLFGKVILAPIQEGSGGPTLGGGNGQIV